MDRDFTSGKEARLDIIGRTKDGTKVNIEMQVTPYAAMGDRSLFYWCKAYVMDFEKGKDYDKLTRTVSINILNFKLFDSEKYPDCHSCFGIYDKNTGNQLTDKFEMHFLELPKYVPTNVKEMKPLDCWIAYFLRRGGKKELEELAMRDAMIKEALDAERVFTDDEIQRRHYFLTEKYYRDYNSGLNYARNEGINIGRSEGRLEGIAAIAKNMKGQNYPLEEIEKLTGLSPDEIAKI